MTSTHSTIPSILSPDFERDPFAYYQALRDDPVHWDDVMNAYVVSRYEDVRSILHDSKAFGNKPMEWLNEPIHGRTILQMDGSEHTKHRRLVNPFFGAAGVEKSREKITFLAASMIDSVVALGRKEIDAGKPRAQIDLVGHFAHDYPVRAIAEVMDLPRDDWAIFGRWYRELGDAATNFARDEDRLATGISTKLEIEEYISPIVEERRAGDADDLLSVLCHAEVDGVPLTIEELRGWFTLLLQAGGETTSSSIASIIKNLLSNPDQLAAVYESPDMIEAAFVETLRFSPAAHLLPRSVEEDTKIAGKTIPAGSEIVVMLAAANRDPAKFRDPEEFIIGREDNSIERAFRGSADHLAFGDGRHFCVGAWLSRLEVLIGVGKIMESMRDLQFYGQDPAPEEGIVLRHPVRLDVTYIPA